MLKHNLLRGTFFHDRQPLRKSRNDWKSAGAKGQLAEARATGPCGGWHIGTAGPSAASTLTRWLQRGRAADAMQQSPQANRTRTSELSRRLWIASAGLHCRREWKTTAQLAGADLAFFG